MLSTNPILCWILCFIVFIYSYISSICLYCWYLLYVVYYFNIIYLSCFPHICVMCSLSIQERQKISHQGILFLQLLGLSKNVIWLTLYWDLLVNWILSPIFSKGEIVEFIGLDWQTVIILYSICASLSVSWGSFEVKFKSNLQDQ